MRGQATLPGLHTFRISSAGIKVFPPARAAVPPSQESPAPSSARLRMGVPHLDEMLGGGLPRGYSLLVAGPSGSGKSILASAFLAEGARCGETGVIASFEQNPFRSRSRAVADLIESGAVCLVNTRAPDLSIDEIMQELLHEIRRLKASRVVIDSLSGFELALAPTFREDFRENLARMITGLASTGVTVLLTTELEDRYTDLRFSPYGTAFMTMVARRQQVNLEMPAGRVEMFCDPGRLVQVFCNLLENASKYTPEGGVIGFTAEVAEGNIVMTVSDNGIGIAPEDLPHVLDPLVHDQHVNNATGFNGVGLGVGLMVVRELVAAHGGTVVAQSAGNGLGSQFVVTLPMREAAK